MPDKQYKVIQSFRGSPDGCRVIDYQKDDVLIINTDFPDSLLSVALDEAWVKPVTIVKKKAVKKTSEKEITNV